MKYAIAIVILFATILILLGNLDGNVQAQEPISTYSFRDLMATAEEIIGPLAGTLTAIAPGGDNEPIRPTPRPTRTPTSRTTQAEQIIPSFQALATSVGSSPGLTPGNNGGNQSGTSGRDDRYVLFRTSDLLDIDALVAFTIILSGMWLGTLIFISFIGALLNRMMLRSVVQAFANGVSRIRPVERLMRNLYQAIILLLSLYFLISIPLLVLIIVTLILNINRTIMLNVPGIIILGISVYGGYYLLRALFLGITEFLASYRFQMGYPLTPERAPGLWTLSTEVAHRMKTAPVQAIYLIPDSRIGVSEQGTFIDKITNRGRRILTVGLAAIEGLSSQQLKAILAHEYAHLNHRDTSMGSSIVTRVATGIAAMHRALKEKSYNHLFNPIWLFLLLFGATFFKITLAARRYQELFADRQAAELYGANTCLAALLKLTHVQVSFDVKVQREIKEAMAEKRMLRNLYQLPPLSEAEESQIHSVVEKILNQPTRNLDSHPSLYLRIAFFATMKKETEIPETQNQAAAELLNQLDAIQELMTESIQKHVNLYQFYTGQLNLR